MRRSVGLVMAAIVAAAVPPLAGGSAGAAPAGRASPTTATAAAAPAAPPAGRVAVQADVSGDGGTDLFWYAPGPTADYFWLALGGGNFRTLVFDVRGDYHPVVGDFDGSGADEIFWYAPGPGTDPVWRWNGSDGFRIRDQQVDGTFTPLVGDFDGSGHDDVLWYAPGAGADALWLGRSDGSFAKQSLAINGFFTPRVGDFDGSGHDDILWYASGAAPDFVWLGAADGEFDSHDLTVNGTYTPVIGDFDGSGHDDVLWYAPGPAGDHLWRGAPAAAFTSRALRIDGRYQPVVGRFDHGGADDLIWYAAGPDPDHLWLASGGGAFVSFPVGVGGLYAPLVGDFDANGVSDVLWYAPGTAPDHLWRFEPSGNHHGRAVGINGVYRAVVAGVDGTVGAPRAPPAGAGGSTAPGPTGPPNPRVEVAVDDLAIPWDLAFLPDGSMLITERRGRLLLRSPAGAVRTLTADLADVYAAGESGLMGIAVDPAFASNRRFYTCQAHAPAASREVQVVAWQLNPAATAATRVADPLLGGLTRAESGRHAGCRLRIDSAGHLWIGTGDGATGTLPQNRASLGGKTLRVDRFTGAGVAGNPFAASSNANARRLFTYGHRNVQGLAFRPGTNQVWSVEHGPTRDDELNLLVGGGNYGWDPVPGYHESVPMTDRGKFPDAVPARWSSGAPTLATSGADFLRGATWGSWDGALAVAALKGASLRIFFLDAAGRVTGQQVPAVLDGTHGRLRSVVLGPDGNLYVTTANGSDDKVLRVRPD